MNPGFIRHLISSLLGASAARALSFIMLPLAARLYSKDDFGGLALALGFAGMLPPLLTLRYEIAVVLVRSAAAARTILWGLLAIALVGYAIVALLVIATPDLLSHVIEPHLIANLRAPVLLHIGATVLNVAIAGWRQRSKAFGVIAASQVGGTLTTAVVALGAPFVVGPSLPVLVWAYAIGTSASVAVLTLGSERIVFPGKSLMGNPRRILILLAKYRVYPSYSLPLTVSSLVSDRVLLVYLTTFSVGTLGGFFPVRQLLFGLTHLVTASISQVVFSHVSQMATGIASARRALLSIARGIAITAGLGLGWLYLYPTELTLILFGERWRGVAPMIPWIATHAAALAISGWQPRLLDIARRQRTDAMLQIVGDCSLLACIATLWWLGVSATVAVAAVSMFGVAQSIAWLIIVYRVLGLGAKQAIACESLLPLAVAGGGIMALLCKVALGNVTGMIVSFAATAFAMLVTAFITAHRINHMMRASPSGPRRIAAPLYASW
jgi:lipopolysaccharide exporter